MGGALGGALAARRPDLVRAAVLEDPGWMDELPWGDPEEVTAERVADAQFASDDADAAIDQCRAEHPTWPESELRPVGAGQGRRRRGLPPRRRRPAPGPVARDRSAIRPPTLVVTGDREVILNPVTRAEIAELNPSLQVHVVEGAAHCVRRDRGDAFHAVVDPWLAGAGRLSGQPPATAGMMLIWAPSGVSLPRPSRKRTSSLPT